MTQLHFSLNLEELKDSVMNSNIETVIKSSIVLVLNEFMEKERDQYLNAAAYERTSDRKDYRNGYYDRDLVMKIGRVLLTTRILLKHTRGKTTFTCTRDA